MSLAALRASVRKTALPARIPKARFRPGALRRYSTPAEEHTPPPKYNTALYGTIGLVAVGAVAYYGYTTFQSADGAEHVKAKSNSKISFKPAQEDYQKVCCNILNPKFHVLTEP